MKRNEEEQHKKIKTNKPHPNYPTPYTNNPIRPTTQQQTVLQNLKLTYLTLLPFKLLPLIPSYSSTLKTEKQKQFLYTR